MSKVILHCSLGAVLQAAGLVLAGSGNDSKQLTGLVLIALGTGLLIIGGRALAGHRGLTRVVGGVAAFNIFGVVAILLASLPTDRSRKVAIFGAYGGVLASIVGALIWSQLPDPRIRRVSQEIFQAQVEGDGEFLWNSACPELQEILVEEHGSRVGAISTLQRQRESYALVDRWEMGNILDFGETATVSIVLYSAEGVERVSYLYLIKIDEEWKIHR